MKNLLKAFVLLMLTACAAGSANAQINNFEECVKAGNVVRRSLPAQCVTKEGQIFIDNETKDRLKAQAKSFCKDLCGDGTCQEMVCMAEGCPCAESKETCPKDCK